MIMLVYWSFVLALTPLLAAAAVAAIRLGGGGLTRAFGAGPIAPGRRALVLVITVDILICIIALVQIPHFLVASGPRP